MLGSIIRSQMIRFSLGQIVVTSVIMGALKKQGAITQVLLPYFMLFASQENSHGPDAMLHW